MLSQKELKDIETQYRDQEHLYRELAEHVLEKCNNFRKQNPKVARIIFSREPLLKTLESITRKIEDRRTSKEHPEPEYNYASLNDIVAISVLCPFESDIAEFSGFLRRAFEVAQANDDVALRDYKDGHRGYHFTVSVLAEELLTRPNLVDLKCEIQVKTILAEAFDAKSHDLAYKPGHFQVGAELKLQFALLASGLKSIDGQSEFLKSLIVRDQKQLDIRRKALLQSYLSQSETINAGKEIGIDLSPDSSPDFVQVFNRLRKPKTITPELCKFAALCALKYENGALAAVALGHANSLMKADPVPSRDLVLGGYVHSVLGSYAVALDQTRRAIHAKTPDEDSPDWVRKARNNFVYIVCDANLFKHFKTEALIEEASGYVDQIVGNGDMSSHELDSVGLFRILFGSFPQIEEGREFLKQARAARANHRNAANYQNFYNLHDMVGLSRLARLAKEIFDQPLS